MFNQKRKLFYGKNAELTSQLFFKTAYYFTSIHNN